MNLVDMTLSGYLGELGSDAPAPGGGSASALCGAQGAALTAMVAGLTVGKKKYEEHSALCEDAGRKASRLKEQFEKQIDLDTEAFNLVSAAFKLPKESDEEKSARRAAIADATLTATKVPFETMELALECLKITQSMVGKSNQNAASDLGVAALNLESCAKGAWLNVLINLGGVKDEAKAAAFSQKGKAIIEESSAIAGQIYADICASL